MSYLFIMVSALFGFSQAQAQIIVPPPSIAIHGNFWQGYTVLGWGPRAQYWPIWTPNFFQGFHFVPMTVPNIPFVALSFSAETHQYGIGLSYTSAQMAGRFAKRSCQDANCKPVAWVRGGCVAIAGDSESKSVGWSYAANARQAESMAVASCHRFQEESSTGTCEMLAFQCTH